MPHSCILSFLLSRHSRALTAEWELESHVIEERLSPLTGSAQAWGSAGESVQPCPHQTIWPLLGSVCSQSHCKWPWKATLDVNSIVTANWTKRRAFLGVLAGPGGPWDSQGYSQVISFLISAEQGGDRRGLDTGKSHHSPWNSTNVHLTLHAGAWPCFAKSQRWRIKLSAFLEFTIGNSYHHSSSIWRVTIKHDGTHKTQGRNYWLGKEGRTGGLWRKGSNPAGLWSLRNKSEGMAFKDGNMWAKANVTEVATSWAIKERGCYRLD